MTTKPLFKAIISGLISGVILYGLAAPLLAMAVAVSKDHATYKPTLVYNGRLTMKMLDESNYHVVKSMKMVVTGYSSTEDQTDSTPFLTASQKRVRRGIIAINGLPFGTKVRMPELFGDEVFDVQDRMHSRKGVRHADVWFEDTQEAIRFGAKFNISVQIIES